MVPSRGRTAHERPVALGAAEAVTTGPVLRRSLGRARAAHRHPWATQGDADAAPAEHGSGLKRACCGTERPSGPVSMTRALQ